MADAAGQWHVLIDCYGRHLRRVARSNWLLLLLWPTPQEVLTVAAAALEKMPTHEQLRSKTTVLIHRLSWCFYCDMARLLPSVLAPLVLHSPKQNVDTLAVLQVLNVLLTKLPAETMLVVFEPLLLPSITMVFAALPRFEDPSDVRIVRKGYFQLLLNVAASDSLRPLFMSTKNAPHIQSILQTVLQGCLQTPDSAKVAFIILKHLCCAWLPARVRFFFFLSTQISFF